MKKLNYTDITNSQLIDIRTQHDFQAGHLKNSLNLNLGNFKKYATYYLDSNQPIIFVVNSEHDVKLEVLFELAKSLGFTKVNGYLSIDEVPNKALQTTKTIPAEEFLNKSNDFTLLDVRHPDEITRPAPEKNLVNIPFENLITEHPYLNSDKTVYTLCGSGNRGTAAASYLETKGFNPVVIEGGIKAIQEKLQQ